MRDLDTAMPFSRRVLPGALATAAVAVLAACGGMQPQIDLTPTDRAFAPLGVRITGLPLGETVTLTATTQVDVEHLASEADLTADA